MVEGIIKTAAILVIGNEVLSGRTEDKNINAIACRLFQHGVDLLEVRIVPDNKQAIISAVQALAEQYDYVFTTGGIGPTHDDITASCIAEAFGQEYGLHPEADAILRAYYQARTLPYNNARRRMAHMPLRATLIENPDSGAPGFQCQNVYVLPGVPSIMRTMFDGLLASGRIAQGTKWHLFSVTIHRPESEIAAMLQKLESDYVGLEVGSYPRQDAAGNYLVNVVFRHRDAALLAAAKARFQADEDGLYSQSTIDPSG